MSNKNKPKFNIGIYASSSGEQSYLNSSYQSFCRRIAYMLKKDPVITIITTDSDLEEIIKTIDLLIIPGGADVDPRLYDEKPSTDCGRINVQFEYLDSFFKPNWVLQGKPTIGICRGMQTLNVMFEGSLFQHIIGHDQSADDLGRSQLVQFVNYFNEHATFCQEIEKQAGIESKTLVTRILKVNSFHHQAVKRLGKNLTSVAWTRKKDACPTVQDEFNIFDSFYVTDKDSKDVKEVKTNLVIEAFVHTEFPCFGVQWHPEDFNCEIIQSLIETVIIPALKPAKLQNS